MSGDLGTYTCFICHREYPLVDPVKGLEEMLERGFELDDDLVAMCESCNAWVIRESVRLGWMTPDGKLTEAGKAVRPDGDT